MGVFSDAIIGILAAIAQQERIRLSDRTKAGLERVRAKAFVLGGLSRERRREPLYGGGHGF